MTQLNGFLLRFGSVVSFEFHLFIRSFVHVGVSVMGECGLQMKQTNIRKTTQGKNDLLRKTFTIAHLRSLAMIRCCHSCDFFVKINTTPTTFDRAQQRVYWRIGLHSDHCSCICIKYDDHNVPPLLCSLFCHYANEFREHNLSVRIFLTETRHRRFTDDCSLQSHTFRYMKAAAKHSIALHTIKLINFP